MKTMHKLTVIGAGALSLGLMTTTALSGPGMGCDGWGHGGGMGGRGMPPEERAQMMQEYHAQRFETLRAELKLAPNQEDGWRAFVAAHDAQRQNMMGMRGKQAAAGNAVERMNERVQFMEERLTGMKAVAAATDTFYASLNPEQKTALDSFFASRPDPGQRGPR